MGKWLFPCYRLKINDFFSSYNQIPQSIASHPCSKFLATAKVGLAHCYSFRGGGSHLSLNNPSFLLLLLLLFFVFCFLLLFFFWFVCLFGFFLFACLFVCFVCFVFVLFFCFVLFCFVLFCFVLFCFALFWFGLVWFGLVWFGFGFGFVLVYEDLSSVQHIFVRFSL